MAKFEAPGIKEWHFGNENLSKTKKNCIEKFAGEYNFALQ